MMKATTGAQEHDSPFLKLIGWAGLLFLLLLCGAVAYLAIQSFGEPELIEAKSAVDPATLSLQNSGCKILSTNGERLEEKALVSIPAGSFLTTECFRTGQQ